MTRVYDPKVLKKLQQTELGILKDFLQVCEENGLTCFGLAGTALGAIRHGGFIPWDGDVDVMLDRTNYEKFRAVSGELGEDYFFQSKETETAEN